MRTLRDLQLDHAKWVVANFGQELPHMPLLGIVEEIGELEEAVALGREDKVKDAIGDVFIYLIHYCTTRGWDIEQIGGRPLSSAAPSLGVWVGKLAHAHLKQEQGIRGQRIQHEIDAKIALQGIVAILRHTACLYGCRLEDLVWAVWEEVRDRDWKKNPEKGH